MTFSLIYIYFFQGYFVNLYQHWRMFYIFLKIILSIWYIHFAFLINLFHWVSTDNLFKCFTFIVIFSSFKTCKEEHDTFHSWCLHTSLLWTCTVIYILTLYTYVLFMSYSSLRFLTLICPPRIFIQFFPIFMLKWLHWFILLHIFFLFPNFVYFCLHASCF